MHSRQPAPALWRPGQNAYTTRADGRPGAYQLQAAISAVHCEASTSQDTDWTQILALLDILLDLSGNPVVALNRTAAVTMVHRPEQGLAELDAIDAFKQALELEATDAEKSFLRGSLEQLR